MNAPQKILILDDDENDFLLTQDMLQQVYGTALSIDHAENSDAADKLIGTNRYDTCLVDYYLGKEINGIDWAQSVISMLGIECPPIIMLTGVDSFENLDLNASETGIADFIIKSELTAKHLEHSIRYAMQTRHLFRELFRSNARYRLFFNHAFEGILLLDEHGRVLQANRSAEQLFCYEKESMTGLYIHQLISDFPLEDYAVPEKQSVRQDSQTMMERMKGRDQLGHPLDLEVGVNMSRTGDEAFFAVSLINIRHHLAQHEALIKLAHTDTLTGLMNRRQFRILADQEFMRAERTQHQLFLMMLDIDHFKQVNDTHGHDVGDQALVAIAEVLDKGIRNMDILARWGGEEFLVLLPETSMEGATLIAERIRHQVSLIRLPKIPEGLTISIGLSEAKPGMELKTATSLADEALYLAKSNGRNQVVCHE